jgi:hypothetical protein
MYMKYYTEKFNYRKDPSTEAGTRAYKGYAFGYIEDIREVVDENPTFFGNPTYESMSEIRTQIKHELRQF